jgi:hypothetical protein
MMSVTAQAGDVKATAAAAAASCKNLRLGLTIKPFQSAEALNAILPIARPDKTPRRRLQSAKAERSAQLTMPAVLAGSPCLAAFC